MRYSFDRTRKSKAISLRHRQIMTVLLLKKQLQLSQLHLKICTLLQPVVNHSEIKTRLLARLILAGRGPRARRMARPAQDCTRTYPRSVLVSNSTAGRRRTILMLILVIPPNPILEINLPSPSSLARKKVHLKVCHAK